MLACTEGREKIQEAKIGKSVWHDQKLTNRQHRPVAGIVVGIDRQKPSFHRGRSNTPRGKRIRRNSVSRRTTL